mmetsp:Transcript_38600/g.86935  ORF Transcript_38600/g.86935 Transcript_38600/m.86935 type:complete len:202 (-) Transcript_38600:8-613(-)
MPPALRGPAAGLHASVLAPGRVPGVAQPGPQASALLELGLAALAANGCASPACTVLCRAVGLPCGATRQRGETYPSTIPRLWKPKPQPQGCPRLQRSHASAGQGGAPRKEQAPKRLVSYADTDRGKPGHVLGGDKCANDQRHVLCLETAGLDDALEPLPNHPPASAASGRDRQPEPPPRKPVGCRGAAVPKHSGPSLSEQT